LGRRIELIEERMVPEFTIQPTTQEGKLVQEVMQALKQQFPLMPLRTKYSFPKIILFLTEDECEKLGINFDVNQVYEVKLEEQAIKFRKV